MEKTIKYMEKTVRYIDSDGNIKSTSVTYDETMRYQDIDKLVINELEFSIGYVPTWWYD